MAAAGGHWVKGTSGPYAGKINFVPTSHTGTVTVNGNDYEAIIQGKVFAGQIPATGKWQVAYIGADGNPHPVYHKGEVALFDTQAQAQKKMASLNAQGVTKAINKGGDVDAIDEVSKVSTLKPLPKNKAAGLTVTEPGAKTIAPKTVKVTEPGAKNIKGETAAAQVQAAATTAPKVATTITANDFETLSAPITVKTASGKEITKPGIDLGNGYMITKSSKGEYYLVDKATNKTVSSSYKNVEDAHAYAKANTPYFNPPPDLPKSYTLWPDMYAAEKAITGDLGHYYQQHAVAKGYNTPGVKAALHSYQDGGYGAINDHLWKGKAISAGGKESIAQLDKAFSKAATPYDLVAVRSKGKGSSLYKLASGLEVGYTYPAKGFDSAGLHYNNNWNGGGVRLVYRVPKGAPALIVNGVHGNFHAYSGENEILFSRNIKWKVVGKKVSGGNIELHLDYDGTFTP